MKLKTFFPSLFFLFSLFFLTSFLLYTPPAHAFCGFYVARADTELYNKASEVAIARDGKHTILTMANDFQGDVSDFAMVIPVPTVISQQQVEVAEPAVLSRLDDFSAPRLVEYFDSDPCQAMYMLDRSILRRSEAALSLPSSAPVSSSALGVTIEEQFSVGEYDILILSARESDGLETWLRQNEYRLPEGASEVLAPYIRQGMKFFVAKVNLEEFDQREFQQLRPLQIEYDSPRYMLPIRLGMLNADEEQDLIVYLLSPEGRAELTNYRTVNVPTDVELPLFVQEEFGDFYPEMFQRSYEAANKEVAFLEYAWDTRGCDPCSSPPLTPDELREAGAFWIQSNDRGSNSSGTIGRPPSPPRPPQNNAGAFITRLHVRYSRDKFPEDLMFQSTGNRQFFQGRYVTRHPFAGNIDCAARLRDDSPTQDDVQGSEQRIDPNSEDMLASAIERGEEYNKSLAQRFEREAQTLSRLTGRNVQTIRQRISDEVPQPTPSRWLLLHPQSAAAEETSVLGWD
ncbi:MAG: DUF2330 domain-containing protein [Cyanobacteria bacterium J06627_28]